MLQLLNLKSISIALAVAIPILSGIYLKGCSDGKEKGRAEATEEMQAEVNKWKGQYQDLRDAPPKIETRTVTKYITLPPRVDTVAQVSGESEDEVTSAPYIVQGPGVIQATYMRLAQPWERFRFDFQPSPLRVDTVFVTETKTALEYVEVSIFEQAEFYVLTVIAAVGGYALAGGF